jgi:hypothetical protein
MLAHKKSDLPDLQSAFHQAKEMGEGVGADQVLLRSVQKAPSDQMKPIPFSCTKTLPLAPHEIANRILDLAKWPDFRGYGPIPGIKTAEFESRTATLSALEFESRTWMDRHTFEEIVQWFPDRQLQLQMKDFSTRLSHLATSFLETWEIQQMGSHT